MEAELKKLTEAYREVAKSAMKVNTNRYYDAAEIMIKRFNEAINAGKTLKVKSRLGNVYEIDKEVFVSWVNTSKIKFHVHDENFDDGLFATCELGEAVSIEED